MRAISAIDIALWDILGQVTNQPVYRLLGGKCRDDIRIYNTCVSHGQYFDRENFINQPGKLAEDLLKEGISAMKIWPFDDFSIHILEQRAADIIMPDICWVGGISEIKKIATLSSSYQLPIAPHNCGGPIQTLAYSHVCVSTENVLILETVRSFYHTYYEEIITNIPEIKNGYLYPNDLPGIGTKLSPKFLNSSDVIRKESKHVNTSLGWTSGDPWNGDVGNKF